MNVDPSYISAIPEHAREEDITGKHGAGRGKVVKNYYLGRSYVGRRVYNKDGLLEHECSYKNGKRHGWEYQWNEEGGLSWALPYDNGREHGTARVWGGSGALLGSYTKDHGTGIDFWWIELEGKAQLTEARVVVDNQMDGYEYWFAWYNPGVLRKEKWWSKGDLHGIEREWNDRGRLRRGFPKYWIHGEKVDKRAYDRAVKADTTLRPFRIEDNQPYRIFPPEVAANLP
jgi:hypothetical protein